MASLDDTTFAQLWENNPGLIRAEKFHGKTRGYLYPGDLFTGPFSLWLQSAFLSVRTVPVLFRRIRT